jgi:signal transduction histidine kinase
MSDVSCKAVHAFLDVATARGVDPALLTDGLGYSSEFLRDKNNRVKWADFVTIGARMRQECHLADEDLEEIGRGVFKSGGLRFVMSLARVLGDPARFYKWWQRGNNILFANMQSQVDIEDRRRLSIRIWLRDEDMPSHEFLLISKGGIASMPTLLGYPEANVELTTDGRGAVFAVTMRPKRRSWIRRLIEAIGGISVTADELLTTNEALTRRLAELSAAHEHIQTQTAQLDEQASRLQLAHEVSKMIHGKFDLQATLDRIVEALGTHTQATMVELKLIDGSAAAALAVSSEMLVGPRSSAEMAAVQPFEIEIRGKVVATLALTVPSHTGLATTLEYVLPVVAMAIDNALSFRELAEYQRGLEKLVDERTSDLRLARDDLAATVVQLKEVQGSRDVFFANISHEIRTPLSLIMLAAGDIEMSAGASLDERARANLTSVVSGARKLLRLVDELLLLAAGEETKLRLKREPMDLGQLVSSVVETWRPAAEAAGLTLRRTGVAQARVLADPTAVDRIISNLVSNAVKFTPRGGSVTVEVSELAAEPGFDRAAAAQEIQASAGDGAGDREAPAGPRGPRIAVSVRDTGVGIDDDLAKRLFGRFERSTRNNGKSGSGIGLSLVKQLTEAHGGTVSVLRPEGGGAELHIELPREPAARSARESSRDAARSFRESRAPFDVSVEVGPSAPWSAKPRLGPADFGVTSNAVVDGKVTRPPGTSLGTILVAEDDPGLSEMVVRLLSDEYVVISASDGFSALEAAKQHLPHLLVTDVQMPGMDGIELAQRFRSVTNDRLAPVVIMSAIGDPGTRVKGLEAGAVDYVVKPFDPRELRARVRSQLRMRDLAVRLHQAEQLSALGTLSAGLAHELRNPANGIINAIRPLMKLLPPELSSKQSPVGQLLDVASGCADQIAFLSRQLLNFRSNGELELRKMTVAELVKRGINLTQQSLSTVEVRLALSYEGEVRCAPQLMLQVLTNLLDNAAQAANPDGAAAGGWIEVVSHTDGTTITLEISDSGGGVPVDLRERVFEPFFTTKPPGVGTGLGLPLARDIVHRHGGRLEIRDRGAQCVFAIDLPVRQ